MSGRVWTGLADPKGSAFPQGCGGTGHRGQSPPLSRHRPLCGNAGGTLAWAPLGVHTPSGARGLGGQLLFLASGDLVGLHARGASLPRSLFSFGGAGICSSCVNPEVVASPVRKHSCDFLACDLVLGPQPLHSSPPQGGPGVTMAPRRPCGVMGACGSPGPKARLAMGLPGPPPAPSQRSLRWGLRTSARASFLSTPDELGAPFGQCGQRGRGRTHQLPILQETAPFPIAQSSNSAHGSDSRCFWHQEEPSVNPGTWPGQARVPVDPVSTSGQATGQGPPPSRGASSMEDTQGAGSRERQSGTSEPSLKTRSPCCTQAPP